MKLAHWACLALAAFARTATAAYPDRPITMIVAYVPGGGTDMIAKGNVIAANQSVHKELLPLIRARVT